MNSIVVGASGFIGARLLAAARRQGPARGTSTLGDAASLLAYDIAVPGSAVERDFAGDDIVFFAAGQSSPDACTRDPERARAINVTGTIRAIEAALANDARVIFFSSDTVYGECDTDIDEKAPCDPAGDYAAMKSEVEQRFAGHPQVKVLRLSYVFSHNDKFTQYLQHCATDGTQAEIFHPFYRAVVHLDDVVDAAIAVASRWNIVTDQIVNVGGPEILSRIEVAETLRRGAMTRLVFRVTEPAAAFFVNRPRVIRMRSPHLATLLGRPARTFDEAVGIEFYGRRESQ